MSLQVPEGGWQTGDAVLIEQQSQIKGAQAWLWHYDGRIWYNHGSRNQYGRPLDASIGWIESVLRGESTSRRALYVHAPRSEPVVAPLPTEALDRLAAEIHEAWEWQYDQCDHGTYQGGPSHGKPYEMCRLTAERITERRGLEDLR